MGLKFCNEAIIALKQIWPTTNEKEQLSPLQVSFNNKILDITKIVQRNIFLLFRVRVKILFNFPDKFHNISHLIVIEPIEILKLRTFPDNLFRQCR